MNESESIALFYLHFYFVGSVANFVCSCEWLLSCHVAVLTLNDQLCYCSIAVCPKEEECALIWILWSDEVPGTEIHQTLSANALSVVYPTKVCTNGLTGSRRVDKCNWCRMTIVMVCIHYWWECWMDLFHNIEQQMGNCCWGGTSSTNSYSCTHEIIHNLLGFSEIRARWFCEHHIEE